MPMMNTSVTRGVRRSGLWIGFAVVTVRRRRRNILIGKGIGRRMANALRRRFRFVLLVWLVVHCCWLPRSRPNRARVSTNDNACVSSDHDGLEL